MEHRCLTRRGTGTSRHGPEIFADLPCLSLERAFRILSIASETDESLLIPAAMLLSGSQPLLVEICLYRGIQTPRRIAAESTRKRGGEQFPRLHPHRLRPAPHKLPRKTRSHGHDCL